MATTKQAPAAKLDQIKIGQLVSMDWKLGVAVKSSHCTRLNSPFVSVSMRVADNNGNINAYSLELTLPEFQDFAKQFKAIATSLDAESEIK